MRLGRRTAIAAAALALLHGGAALAQTTITMWTFLNPTRTSPREVALRQMIEGFERANPNIRIRVEPQDFAQMPPRFFLGHRTGQNPDIVWIDAKNLGGLIQSGAAADLNQAVVRNWSQADRDDFFVRAGWDAARTGERLHALPLFHGASVIYYRRDLLAAAGIDPASLTTWDRVAEAAQRLTRQADGRTQVWGFGMPLAPTRTESTPVLMSLADAAGNQLFDNCRPRFATEVGARAMRYTADLVTRLRVTPQEALTYHVDDITDQFIAGRYAMAITSNLRYSGIVQQVRYGAENVAIMPWPSLSGQGPGPMPVSGWWVAVWNRSPHQAEAARFVDYMVSRDGVRLWATVGGQVPTRRSVLEDPFFAQPQNAWVRTMVQAWQTRSWIEPTECNTRTLQAILNEATHQVVLGNADPMVALRAAEGRFTEAQ